LCAAVDKIEEMRKPEDFVGHRKRSKYQPIILSCIVRAITDGSSPTGGAKNPVHVSGRDFYLLLLTSSLLLQNKNSNGIFGK